MPGMGMESLVHGAVLLPRLHLKISRIGAYFGMKLHYSLEPTFPELGF